ncbi:neuromedin-U receptor 2-like, partial [Brachionus plicatilis]
MAISDTLCLYEWNLNHFIVSFFQVDFAFKSLAWCRLSLFLQYVCLQYSAWILVSIALDRLLSILVKKWQRFYFNDKKPIVYCITLALVLIALNCKVLESNGYINVVNGTELVVCYAQSDNDRSLFYLFGQIHLYLYSIVPFMALLINDGVLVCVVVFSMKKSNAERGNKKKMNMTRTVLILNLSFVFLTLPSAIISGYFYLALSKSDIGYSALIFCDNLTFSFHSFNIITLFFFNSKFRSEFKFVFSKIFGLNRVDSISVWTSNHAVSDITPVCFWRIMSSDKIDIIEIASNWPSLGQDRQEREQNIIISGFSESPTSNDNDLVKQFFHEVNESRLSPSSSRIQASTIKSVRRLKSSNLSSSNPSLILVSFFNPSDRDRAIKACSRHRAADFANVMVREDRTPAQQAAFIKQRQEIRKLNDELEEYKLLEQYRNVLHKSRNTIVCIDLAKSAAA